MSEWQNVQLGEVINFKNGFAFKSADFVDSGIPVIKIKNVKPNRINLNDLSYVKESVAKGKEKYLIEPSDILITMSGNRVDGSPDSWVGKVAKFKLKGNFLLNQRVSIIQAKEGLSDADYLGYVLSSWETQQYLINHANSSGGQANISPDTVKGIEIDLPSLLEQKAIASVLSSLDDKIDILHRQNKTLEAMAETLFRQWFVEGAQEDWENITIADLVDFNPTRKLAKGSVAPYLEMAALSNTTFHPDGWYDREFSSGTKFINGDTLLARITPCLENGKTAFITFLKKEQVAWGSTEYIVMCPKVNLHPLFAYVLARNSDFRDYAEGCMEGSSGRQRVNVDHLKNYDIKNPPESVIREFNSFAESIAPKLHSNFLQIRTLEKLRDTLLPKLMSGEVRVAV